MVSGVVKAYMRDPENIALDICYRESQYKRPNHSEGELHVTIDDI